LSDSWQKIYKTGNETNQEHLDLFRQFHCADCLKSFQQIEDNNKFLTSENHNKNSYSNISKENSLLLKIMNDNRAKMNSTPPAQLQPLCDDAMTGLINYFGPLNNGPTLINNKSDCLNNGNGCISLATISNTTLNPNLIIHNYNLNQNYTSTNFSTSSNVLINPNNNNNNNNDNNNCSSNSESMKFISNSDTLPNFSNTNNNNKNRIISNLIFNSPNSNNLSFNSNADLSGNNNINKEAPHVNIEETKLCNVFWELIF
jgi:hypothetical protein